MAHLNRRRYVLHDRDAKFCAEFRDLGSDRREVSTSSSKPELERFAER
jgi:hypothetical protein